MGNAEALTVSMKLIYAASVAGADIWVCAPSGMIMRVLVSCLAIISCCLIIDTRTMADSPPRDLVPKFMPPVVPASPSAPLAPRSPVAGATANDAALEATTAKFNAYIRFMNRTLRASDSLDRYKSWVNMRTGPTGRERVIYGLYGVYDVRGERAAAESALQAKPLLPDLDDAMRAYIAANDMLAPVLNKANGYYEREDYKIDHMAEGKALHQQIVTDGTVFLTARQNLEAVMRVEKYQFDKIRLATIEQHEGRSVRWHITDVMIDAKRTLDTLQGRSKSGAGSKPGIDMPAFNADMAAFGEAVKTMDDYAAEHPGAFSAFETFPASMLGRLREVQGRLARTHGDVRRAAGLDMTFILSDYNTMVTTSDTALSFIR